MINPMRFSSNQGRYITAFWAAAILLPGGQLQAGSSTREINSPAAPSHGKKHRKHGKPRKAHSPTHSPKFHPVATFDDPYGDEQLQQASDPLERMNRGTFAFNAQFYRFVTKPLARFTNFIFPTPVRISLENAVENLEAPVRITSSLLQGKVKRSAQETGKLLVNSTMGVGGLWKASDRFPEFKNIPREDMGQTFGAWGIPSGPYLVLPILGPSSARDFPGKAADTCLTPSFWLREYSAGTIASASKSVIENPKRMSVYDDATKDALDPYVSVRESFTSYRKKAVEK